MEQGRTLADTLRDTVRTAKPLPALHAFQTLLERNVVRLIEENIPNIDGQPICLAGGVFANVRLNKLVKEMGFLRYNVFMHLMLWFALIPIKMLLRWTVNLKYIVGIPEWFFNV